MGSVDIDNPNQSDHRGCTVHLPQPVHIDTTLPCHQLTISKLFPISVGHQVHPLTDLAHASAAECNITCDVPHCEAVNTLTQAASPMYPATTFADANGVMAVHQHAMSRHAFPIDSSTTLPSLKRQETACPPPSGAGMT